MMRARVIPCLLLKNKGLVKTVRFEHPIYIGCPINAIKLFNEKEVDELVFLDITASKKNKKPYFNLISEIASECFMPFCYGGGVKTLEDMEIIFGIGAEKISINTQAVESPNIIREGSKEFGSQSIVVSVDVKRNLFGKYRIFSHRRGRTIAIEPVEFALRMEDAGAGELFVNSVDRDGTMHGYDLDLLRKISSAVGIPVIACGGAGTIKDFAAAIKTGGASAVAAGSMFVFYGKHRAVLINYPTQNVLKEVFSKFSLYKA